MSTSGTRTARQQLGDAAEASAARFLESRGLVVLERGHTRRCGEIDLVCVEPATRGIVFVEVRYRSSHRYGGPLASVTRAKAMRLRKTAAAWLQRHADPRRPARIDVIGLSPGHTSTGRPWAEQPLALERSVNKVVLWEDQQLCWLQSAC
jgi:putative endonuclease